MLTHTRELPEDRELRHKLEPLKDLIVIVTSNGAHDDRTSATMSLETLAGGNNFVVFVLTDEPTDDVAGYLRWADNRAPFAKNVDVLTLDELPGAEVGPWADKVVGASA